MGPMLGFTIFNVVVGPRTGRVFKPVALFRSLTIFSIFSNAVTTLIESLLNLFTAAASLQQIQSFLLGDKQRHNRRELLQLHDSSPDEDEELLLPNHIHLPRVTRGGAPAAVI